MNVINISLLNRLSSLKDIDFTQYKIREYKSSPEDWRDIVIYQLVTDRFNNPSAPPNYPWNVQEARFQGGNFKGIEEKLEYLENLGVKAIWMSPVQQNCQYLDVSHGYAIQDFLKIDPRFCLNSNDPAGELKSLIDAIHGKGMYVIFDIVLNHGGDVFEYNQMGSIADWNDSKYSILWRDENGNGRWATPPESQSLHPHAGVGPKELFFNEVWRRQGRGNVISSLGEPMGDFESLKELATDYSYQSTYGQVLPVENILINVYKYLIAEFDIDGYRIDTLKYISRNFSKKFGNAIREFAMDIGKKNFFTYGEVWDSEEIIDCFIGRKTEEEAEIIGVDSALDFPLKDKLIPITKGYLAPVELANFYQTRKSYQKKVLSSHGEASRFFVTFLDNHDFHQRYLYCDGYQEQLTLALTCQFTLQGIPCLYYGTEQGLNGGGDDKPENVREALWGKENAFDETSYLYKYISKLNQIRANLPELRYGRLYFRELSGDNKNFGYSCYSPGVIAFSRILTDKEVLIVANCHPTNNFNGSVLIDPSINNSEDVFKVAYSNISDVVETKNVKCVVNANINGNFSDIITLEIDLKPMEVQILVKK